MAIYVALAEPMWVSGIAIIATLGILRLGKRKTEEALRRSTC